MLKFRNLLCAAVIAALLPGSSSCALSDTATAHSVLGRWRQIGQVRIGEPSGLLSEYVEFREGGRLVILLYDQGPDEYWMIGMEHYLLLDDGRIQFSGSCWQGWEKFDCVREYDYILDGDDLRIIDTANRTAVFERIGDVGPDLPPELAPPMPTATPSEG